MALPAFASAATPRRDLERTARKACLTGQYATGVEILSDLYIDSRDPNYLFNQGRCFEQNRRFEEAIGRFEEYLRAAEAYTPKVSENDKAEAVKHIASCKELLAEQNVKPAGANGVEPPPAPPIAAKPEAPVAPPTPPPSRSSTTIAGKSAPRPAPASPGSGLRTGGVVLIASGVVASAAGIAFNMKANALSGDIESAVGGYTPEALSERRNYQTLSWVGYGVGAACVATGAVLYLVGARKKGAASPRLALAPQLDAGQTGFLLSGAF